MVENKEYKFRVSISRDAYDTKEKTKVAIANDSPQIRQLRLNLGLHGQMSYEEKEMTPSRLLQYALNGHSFCSLFGGFNPTSHIDSRDGFFTMRGKCGKYFRGSYHIGIDIDNTHLSVTEFLDRLTLKPTLWYTSLSHLQKDKNNDGILDSRFRLVYVLDSKIEGELYFRYCAYCLSNIIRKDVEEDECIDESAYSCTQYFNGTNVNSDALTVEHGLSNLIYSVSDLNVSESGFLDFLRNLCFYKSRDSISKHLSLIKNILSERFGCSDFSESNINSPLSPTHLISDSDKTEHLFNQPDQSIELDTNMLRDYRRLHWDEFSRIYREQYSLTYRKEKPEWKTIYLKDMSIRYQMCEEDYLELGWIVSKDGSKRKDGSCRRNTLFHRCWLRRVIKPNITPNEMLYNLICDCERFFDNSDGMLNDEFMLTKIRQCFMYSSEQLVEMYQKVYDATVEESRKKRFIIHWMDRKKIRPNSLSKELRWLFLDQFYDQNLSVEENLQILGDSDIDILNVGLSRSTLYAYCKNRGIETGVNHRGRLKRFAELHKEGMSLAEEKRYLEEKGMKLSRNSIREYRKQLRGGE